MEIIIAVYFGLFIFLLVSSIKNMNKNNLLFYTFLALSSIFAGLTMVNILISCQ
ncbi:hypothetical protein Back11_37940 [Paenibacillus baekrokdamisoli]|uniref:Uncharacterized protein n=1 Tax=Paenibacillus baekrokdamisoli TaxID=1712516 RepID=A0A3G9JHF9_9BACL|nr:hypothetical protein [Paenibacillus baekrokdamisoli]BBH22449.1 hypothetical protein Back11_37940 [Paenibacillus baekrokdamisoli]